MIQVRQVAQVTWDERNGLLAFGNGSCGKGDGEDGACTLRLIFGANGATVQFHEILGERQAETRSLETTGTHLVIAVENLLDIACGDARTRVTDTHYIFIARMREGYADAAPIGSEFEGIAHDVVEDAFHLGLVGHGLEVLAPRFVGELYLLLCCQSLKRVGPSREK